MYRHQTTILQRQISPPDGIRTLTIPKLESTFVETLTLGNAVASTDAPVATMSASRSSNPSSNYVGAILSGVVVILALLFIIWVCCRKGRTRSRRSKGSSRKNGSRDSPNKGSSNSSESSGGPSEDDGTVSVAEEQWGQPERPMSGMPPLGRWPGPPPGHMGPPLGAGIGVGMGGMPVGRGGPPPMMGRGGGPPPNFGGPPIIPMASSGGPPPMPPMT
ncbi:hypothetical protein GGR58DRAFT_270650 [Xylaria digitata]|nr:hypothetical protein GGR58DRAFT_270650 [Xylaria digitata]